MLIGKVKARGVGEIMANAGGSKCKASVVTSSAAEIIVIGESPPMIIVDTYIEIVYRGCVGRA